MSTDGSPNNNHVHPENTPELLLQHLPLFKEPFQESNVPISSRRSNLRKQSGVLAVWYTVKNNQRRINMAVYSPVEDEWELLDKTFPLRNDFAAAFFKNELILVGGFDMNLCAYNIVESINLDTMTVSEFPSMALERTNLGIAVLDDGVLFAAGGIGDDGVVDSVERYHPNDSEWSDVAPMLVGRYVFGLAVLDGRLIAVGGRDRHYNILNSTECYDPKTDKWTMLANLNIARYGPGIASGNGCVYVVGGQSENGALKSIERYDSQADNWTEICLLSSPRSMPSCIYLDDRLLVLSSHDERTSLQEYNFVTETWAQRAMLLSQNVAHSMCCLKI